MFTVQCSITNIHPPVENMLLSYKQVKFCMWKTKNHKKQLGSLKKQTLILTLPKKNQKIQSFFKFSFTVIVSIK